MKKYELTSEYVEFDGRKLYRIKALKSFYLCGLTVKAGALGGYIEKEENLSQEGNAWIHGNAYVYDNAYVRDNAFCSDEDYAAVQGFRTKFKFATFYRAKDEKVMVYCGDFNGNLEGFREWAKKTFDGKNQKEYLTIADFMEQHFAPEKEED